MKIIATISEQSYGADSIEEIIRAGADVLRYHFSKQSPEELEQKIRTARFVIDKLGLRRKVKILADLPTDFYPSKNLRDMSPEWVAFSGVANAAHLKKEKHLLIHHLGYCPTIIAKIETNEGVENIKEIAAVSDILFVNREAMREMCPIELLGVYQKKIVSAAKHAGKQAMISVQFFSTNEEDTPPSISDVLDITNAMQDGVDGLLLLQGSGMGALKAAKRIIDALHAAV